jgi:hypothetical protein
VVFDQKVDDYDAQYAIDLYFMCRHLRCLPEAGGLKDQDSRDVWLLGIVAKAEAERHKLDQKQREAEARGRR